LAFMSRIDGVRTETPSSCCEQDAITKATSKALPKIKNFVSTDLLQFCKVYWDCDVRFQPIAGG